MISELCAEKYQIKEWRILTISKFNEKLHFTVGHLKWWKMNISTPKEKLFKIYFTEFAEFLAYIDLLA